MDSWCPNMSAVNILKATEQETTSVSADDDWSALYGVAHIGATWRIRLNRPCTVAMRPYVKLLWRFDHVLWYSFRTRQSICDTGAILTMCTIQASLWRASSSLKSGEDNRWSRVVEGHVGGTRGRKGVPDLGWGRDRDVGTIHYLEKMNFPSEFALLLHFEWN